MNDRQLENKVRQDAEKVKKDMRTLMKDGVSHLSGGFEKLTGNAKETVVGAVAAVKEDVGHGLNQYNAKAQKVAAKVPGGFGEKAARYPWVAISIALAVGFVLGNLFKPTRQSNG